MIIGDTYKGLTGATGATSCGISCCQEGSSKPLSQSLGNLQIMRFKLAKKFCEWIDNPAYISFYSDFLNTYCVNNYLSPLNAMIISNNIRTFVTLPQQNNAEAKRNVILFINNLDFGDMNLNTFCKDIFQM